jgi:hypothetical protein
MGLSFRSRIEPEADGTVAVIQMRDLTEDNKPSHRNLTTIEMNRLGDHHLVKRRDLIFRSSRQTTTAAIIDTKRHRQPVVKHLGPAARIALPVPAVDRLLEAS